MQQKESKSSWHFNISLFKSCLRIVAGIAIVKGEFIPAGMLLIVAEVFGIVEEL